MQSEAVKLAEKAGKAKLEALRSKDDATGFGDAKTVSRMKAEGFNNAALAAVMKADASRLPAYAGVDLGQNGYGIFRITKVIQPTNLDAARREAEQQQIANALSQQEMLAYLEVLKKKAKAEILKPVGSENTPNIDESANVTDK